jgi:hypothetical protein
LLEADVANEFLAHVEQARARGLTSDERFTVDGTLLEAWAGAKSFQPKDKTQAPPDDPGTRAVMVGGDKGFDTRDFVKECRNLRVTPHVAQNHERRGGCEIDGRSTRHVGYAVSQRKRKRIEECFGWLRTIALMRKLRHRGVRRWI